VLLFPFTFFAVPVSLIIIVRSKLDLAEIAAKLRESAEKKKTETALVLAVAGLIFALLAWVFWGGVDLQRLVFQFWDWWWVEQLLGSSRLVRREQSPRFHSKKPAPCRCWPLYICVNCIASQGAARWARLHPVRSCG
jgi:hypothetical protein